MYNLGTMAIGLEAPLIQQGDDIEAVILSTLVAQLDNVQIEEGDILGITESCVARASGLYCTKEMIQRSLLEYFSKTKEIILFEPICSRNRFSFILKAIAEVFKKVTIIWRGDKDEVGNVIYTKHPYTGIIYRDFYKQLVEEAGAIFDYRPFITTDDTIICLDCRCHPESNSEFLTSLGDICSDISKWGLLGSNLAGNRLKLFPNNCDILVKHLKEKIKASFGVNVDVLVYGDGCYKDPLGIWEWADPVACVASTIQDTLPTEFKLKYVLDTEGEEGVQKRLNRVATSELGTTPRNVNNLLASLMDLTSGSGSKGTPLVLVKNYFHKIKLDD